MIGESNTRAAFKIENAKSVTITLAAGSNNILKSGLEYAGLQNDSVPLIITGSGSLTAESGQNDAGTGGSNIYGTLGGMGVCRHFG